MIVPYQEAQPGKGVRPLQNEKVTISSGASDVMTEILNKIKDNEYLIENWSPVHLKPRLESWFWKEDKPEVLAFDVWRSMCRYLYLDRLTDVTVLHNAIEVGVRSGSFGIAYAVINGEYKGFAFEQQISVAMDESLLLIEPQTAQLYVERKRQEEEARNERSQTGRQYTSGPGTTTGMPPRLLGTDITPGGIQHYVPTGGEYFPGANVGNDLTRETTAQKNRFYGTVKLNVMTAKIDFGTIYDEILKHFVTRPGSQIEITLDISAHSESGFDDSLQRIIRENMRQLKFQSGEFEEE